MNIKQYILEMGKRAREVSRHMAKADTNTKNKALMGIADALLNSITVIKRENDKDLQAGRDNGLDAALLDRLALDDDRIMAMAQGIREITALPDPIGEITNMKYRPSGIQVGRMRVPLGVIGIIYESRPNVTADAAALCLKAGNAAILRGGSEACHSNQVIATCIRTGLNAATLPEMAVQVIEPTDRAAVGELIKLQEYVDVIVPRGGKGLIERISAEAKVPIIKHLHGICHVYLHAKADKEKAINIAFNAKTHRYGVCNAMETLLVDKTIAKSILPSLSEMYLEKGVELRGCKETKNILTNIADATAEDWDTEYLAPILSIKLVDNPTEAMDHINKHGSGHTEAIVTEDFSVARSFLTEVDASSVMVNASTRFADGFEYGLGAEIGISTDKIHARGPVGLEGLTSQKYIVIGDGHIR